MLGVKHAYCLCLDKRKEHWEDLKEQCELKLNFTNDLYSSKIETYEEEFEYLNKALKNRNDMILKENSNLSKSINFIGGFAGGTIITLAVLWSVNSVNNVSGN